MQHIRVKKTIDAPIDDVFEAYTDHEALGQLPMVLSAKVTTRGKTEKNGLGAVREVNGGALWLREEVTVFERPRLMEYKILKSIPPTRHELGRVTFAANPGGGTDVVWETKFAVAIPGVGPVVEPGFRAAFEVIFRLVLRMVERNAKKAAA